MQTEFDTLVENPKRGWLFYDGECPLCVGAVRRIGPALRKRHFGLATYQAPWVRARLGLQPGELPEEMKLLAADEQIYGGADAQVLLAKAIWWMWPLFAFAQIPGAMFLLRANYRWVAANRYCLSGMCVRKNRSQRRHAAFFEI